MKRLLTLLAVLAVAHSALACIWSHATTLRGEKVEINELVGDAIVEALREHMPAKFWEERERGPVSKDPESRNDHAVTLLHLGRPKEAIAILVELERAQPGSYFSAVNLGTAYELAGDDVNALRWIREGIRRNANAHDGTEWLHVRILEAKRARAADPRWLDTHSVLGVDFGTAVIPRLPKGLPPGNGGKAVTVQQLKDALWYQLDERYQFVGAPDPFVASLLFDWANLEFRTGSLESAASLYREAIRYGQNMDLAMQRLGRVEQTLRDHALRAK